MTDIPLLSLTIFLPLLGGLVILLIKEDETSLNNIKNVDLKFNVSKLKLDMQDKTKAVLSKTFK